jgi:hypothetical protein
VLEQRTGRADRIGSKTFRERDGGGAKTVYLEIGVPFLAGTYDERMYEELRLRAQTFEVLTGGDLAADHTEGRDDISKPQGEELEISVLPLPVQMMDDLRVKLQVWEPAQNPESQLDLVIQVHPGRSPVLVPAAPALTAASMDDPGCAIAAMPSIVLPVTETESGPNPASPLTCLRAKVSVQ